MWSKEQGMSWKVLWKSSQEIQVEYASFKLYDIQKYIIIYNNV